MTTLSSSQGSKVPCFLQNKRPRVLTQLISQALVDPSHSGCVQYVLVAENGQITPLGNPVMQVTIDSISSLLPHIYTAKYPCTNTSFPSLPSAWQKTPPPVTTQTM